MVSLQNSKHLVAFWQKALPIMVVYSDVCRILFFIFSVLIICLFEPRPGFKDLTQIGVLDEREEKGKNRV